MLTPDRSTFSSLPADVITRCTRYGDFVISGQLSSACTSSSSSLDKASTQVSKGDRYKTELCRTYEENGSCRYGDKCQFAHGVGEMRNVNRHPKYKTDLCRTFHTTGFCPYGARCHFIHVDYKQMVTSSSSTSSSTSSLSGVKRQVPVDSKQSRRDDVGRLLNGLDDELLLALASLIQRQQVTSRQSAMIEDRDLLRSASFDPCSTCDSLSPCPSPNSVFGSGSSDGLCSPVGSTSPMMNHPFQPSKTRCYSACHSPDSASSMFNNWIQPKESNVLQTSSQQLPLLSTSTFTRSYSLNKTVRSIFV